MRMYRYTVLLLASLFLLIINGCEADKLSDSNIVAKYDNDHSITIAELNKYIEDWLYYKKFENRSDVYINALNDMITNQLKRFDFFEKGLNKNVKLIQNICRIINEELVAEYFETQYVGKYANEENAKKIYEIMDKEVVYQIIELSKPENASQMQLDSLQEKALAIKSEIDNGKDFSSLVKEYSQNKNSLLNNGFMPPVGWKQSLSDPVDEIIFQLNKNDIRVLNSENSFMIVKIADINKIPVEPFDSVKNKIIVELKNIISDVSLAEFVKDKKELIDENNLKWNEAALKQIVHWSRMPDFYVDQYKETFKNVIENGDNKIILTYNNGTLDYKELFRLFDNILIMKSSDSTKENHVKDFILEAIRTDLVVKKAESLDLTKNIFNAFTNNLALKIQLVRLYNQAEIEAKIPEPTDEAIHQFFKENENTLYYQLEKRNIFVMVFPNKDEAENASGKIKQGIPFEKVTGRYLVKTYIKDRNGEIKTFRFDEKPIFGEVSFKMKESEVSNPIQFEDENNQTKYAILKCYHIRPEKQLTFNDVKNSIVEDFKNYYRKKIGKETEERLKNKYHPVINEEVFAKLISPN